MIRALLDRLVFACSFAIVFLTPGSIPTEIDGLFHLRHRPQLSSHTRLVTFRYGRNSKYNITRVLFQILRTERIVAT